MFNGAKQKHPVFMRMKHYYFHVYHHLKVVGPGARFTRDLNPKIFVNSIQFVWNLQKS